MDFVFVAIGGAIGAMGRYWVSKQLPQSADSFPSATLIVNGVGALLIGIFMGLIAVKPAFSNFRPLLVTGMLGALTTYSTFAFESVLLWTNGHSLLAISNVLANTLLCLILAALGYTLRSFF